MIGMLVYVICVIIEALKSIPMSAADGKVVVGLVGRSFVFSDVRRVFVVSDVLCGFVVSDVLRGFVVSELDACRVDER